ncbi:MAG: efflux RND transporter periplasmic adaptor subunit [Gammaproteobacteria bacterium]|nr:efflux RND transporter periplasmic adaptor subunit [Gammaproteobacteria bacterium]
MAGQSKSGRLRVWLIAVCLCLATAFGLGWYKYSQFRTAMAFAAAFPEPVESVEGFTARESLWQPTTRVTGEVLAIRAVIVAAEEAGAIVEVGVEPGGRVAAGQLLVRLDTSEERAELAAAKAELEIARLALMRSERLLEAKLGTAEARDEARARFDAAEAARQRIAAVIAKKSLKAPFAATAGLHELDVGQFLDRGDEVVRLIGSEGSLWVDFTLPQQDARLAEGEWVDIFPHGGDRNPVRAKVIARDSFVNRLSRNVRYRSLVDREVLGQDPGAVVTVQAPLGLPQSATLVPAPAVRRDAFGAKLFVLRPSEEGARAPERAERRDVTLGPRHGEFIVIASGLQPGERVAADGAFKLRDGVLVSATGSARGRHGGS